MYLHDATLTHVLLPNEFFSHLLIFLPSWIHCPLPLVFVTPFLHHSNCLLQTSITVYTLTSLSNFNLLYLHRQTLFLCNDTFQMGSLTSTQGGLHNQAKLWVNLSGHLTSCMGLVIIKFVHRGTLTARGLRSQHVIIPPAESRMHKLLCHVPDSQHSDDVFNAYSLMTEE